MTRVFTADGPGKVTDTDTRHGTTWLYIEGAAMAGWYPAREVTADIGDPGRYVTTPEDFPDADDGTVLPYDPRPRDVFHNQLTIQPTSDLPPNLTPTDSVKGLRFTEPNAVFGSTHPFAKEANARHFAESKLVPLGHDFDLDDDDDFNKETLDGASKDNPYPHVPKDYDEDPPGLDDYGEDYDKKNPLSVNPVGDDGPFKTSGVVPDQNEWSAGGNYPVTAPPDPYQQEEQLDGKYPNPLKQADIDRPVPAGWNDKASEEFLDNPFADGWDSDNDGDDDNTVTAGALDALEHLWWGDDYEWLKGMGKDPEQQKPGQPQGRPQDPNARDFSYAAVDGLSNDEDPVSGDLGGPPQVQQVPWDPSHGATPDGGMQVFSPETHDADPAGQLQSILQDDPMEELADNIVDHIMGEDDLQGVEVPHEMDDDDLLMGTEVPHQAPVGPGAVGPGEVGAADNLEDVGPTGNVPIGPYSDNDELAHMAQTFLARTAAKNYSDAEQAALMNEAGVASQLPSLRLSDSIYEDPDSTLLL